MANSASPKSSQMFPRDQEQIIHTPRPDEGSVGGTKEAIVLPSRMSAIERAHQVIRDTPDMRHELVAQVSESLNLDALMLDSQALAEKLIGVQLPDLRPAA